MTIEELGHIGELLAAIATIATLVYLALQIRQSNQSHQLAAIARISESTEEWIGQIAADADLSALYRRAFISPDTLSPEERARFGLLVLRMLRGYETGWFQLRWGVVDDNYWQGYIGALKVVVGSPLGRRAFENNRVILATEFADEVDRILAEHDRDREG